MALVSNTFASHFLDRKGRAAEFELLSQLVNTIPVRRATACAQLSRLPELCDEIVGDFARQGHG